MPSSDPLQIAELTRCSHHRQPDAQARRCGREIDVIIHPTGRFDNRAKSYDHIVVEELAAAMGCEIKGVDLARLTDAQFAEIEHALFRHKMIFFRDQQISHADHEAFSLRFGEFAEDAYTK